ncbi:hypothetical protein AWB73_05376 [Caballeronia turbans]|nr:hypothetical protein AWB73_05376 [Caballeronia turbans]
MASPVPAELVATLLDMLVLADHHHIPDKPIQLS